MRKLTHETRLKHWYGIVQERNNSGKSIRVYCREQSINEKSYYYWQRRLREKAAEVAGYSENTTTLALTESRFAEISLPVKTAVNSAITIRTGNTVVEIENHADRQTIETILKILC